MALLKQVLDHRLGAGDVVHADDRQRRAADLAVDQHDGQLVQRCGIQIDGIVQVQQDQGIDASLAKQPLDQLRPFQIGTLVLETQQKEMTNG